MFRLYTRILYKEEEEEEEKKKKEIGSVHANLARNLAARWRSLLRLNDFLIEAVTRKKRKNNKKKKHDWLLYATQILHICIKNGARVYTCCKKKMPHTQKYFVNAFFDVRA